MNTQEEQWLRTDPNSLISLTKWQKTVNLLASFFDAPASFIVQYREQGFQVTLTNEGPENPYEPGGIIEPEANIFCRRIVETGESLYVSNAPIDPCWDTNPEVHEDGFVSYLGVPIVWPDGTPFGTFCVMDYKETDYNETYIELIYQLKDILESDLALTGVYSEIRQLAMTDPLTKLYNRRGFQSLAEQRVALSKRLTAKLGLFYLDIDSFKQINDNHGHAVGDKVLETVADAMRHSLRHSDILARLGGDEFSAIVMLDDEEADIKRIKQRFIQALQSDIKTNNLPMFSVSYGYSLIDLDNYDLKEVLHQADINMYQHKNN